MIKLHVFACFLAITLSFGVTVIHNKYRLSGNIIPSNYVIRLNLTDDSFVSSNYTGDVEITFIPKNSTNNIQMHTSVDTVINSIFVDDENITSHTFDSDTEIMNFTTNQNLIGGTSYTLRIYFTAKLQTDSMYGFYLSNYTEDNQVKSLATTQFEATYARRAFPCFDEPAYKSVFDMSISAPSKYDILFNTPQESNETIGEIITVQFKKTPQMPTYLLAFIVSEFTCSESSEKIDGSVVHRMCSRNSTTEERRLALIDSPKIMNELSNFLNITYKSHEFDKMDQVAIPDFSAGAMENWGLVTYREVLSLSGKDTTNTQKQRISSVIAHEFAHQWFGNLVTMHWWNEIWLNEGFATYFEYHITDKVRPELDLPNQFVIDEQQTVFQNDALLTVQPLSSLVGDIYTQTNISQKFDAITYNKGGSILRMINKFLGEENFATALHDYLIKHSNNNTNAQDLIYEFELKSPPEVKNIATFATIINNWIYKPGFPVVQLTSEKQGDELKIKFTQSRFLSTGVEDKNSAWYVPITYTTKAENDFITTKPKLWLTENSDNEVTINGTSDVWIIANIQSSGYYRVNYDETLWSRINTALRSPDFSGIPALNRAQLVDDVLNLAKIGKVAYGTAFDILSYLKNDTDYYPWKSALNGLSYLIKRTASTDLGVAIAMHVKDLLQKLISEVTFEDRNTEYIYTQKQVLALTWSCLLGETSCLRTAVEEFQKIHKNEEIYVNLRGIIYCNGLQYSNNSQTDWNALWNKLQTASSSAEETTIRSALGCTSDASLLESYLKKSIDESSGIRRQDALSVFSAVIAGNPKGLNVAFKFLKDNYKQMRDYYKGLNALASAITSIANAFTTESQLKELEEFIARPDLDSDFKNSANIALETARNNLAWVQKYSLELNSYFGIKPDGDGGGDGAASITLSLSLLLGCFIILFKLY